MLNKDLVLTTSVIYYTVTTELESFELTLYVPLKCFHSPLCQHVSSVTFLSWPQDFNTSVIYIFSQYFNGAALLSFLGNLFSGYWSLECRVTQRACWPHRYVSTNTSVNRHHAFAGACDAWFFSVFRTVCIMASINAKSHHCSELAYSWSKRITHVLRTRL